MIEAQSFLKLLQVFLYESRFIDGELSQLCLLRGRNQVERYGGIRFWRSTIRSKHFPILNESFDLSVGARGARIFVDGTGGIAISFINGSGSRLKLNPDRAGRRWAVVGSRYGYGIPATAERFAKIAIYQSVCPGRRVRLNVTTQF